MQPHPKLRSHQAIALFAVALTTLPAAGATSITSVSPNTVAQSGRFIISGTGFGPSQGSSQVLVDGVPAPVTHWSDTSITAYILGATEPGSATLSITAPGNLIESAAIEVLPIEPGTGRVKWRFMADAASIPQRQAVGPDGSVYVQDQLGRVYALAADGLLQWIFDTGGLAEGPIAVGADGTIYASGNPAGPDVHIYAINPDGTQRWKFTDPGVTQGIIAGPSVGPDGNIYAVSEAPGLGAISLTPDGDLRWSNQGDPMLFESGQLGLEIGFNDALGRLYVAFDEIGVGGGPRLYAFGMDDGDQSFGVPSAFQGVTFTDPPYPTVGPDGNVYMNTGNALRSFDPQSGSILWTAFPFTNGVLKPSIGADGRIYTVRALSTLTAVNPSSSTAWSVMDPGILFAPVVGPDGTLIVLGGRINFGQPGFIKAFTDGGATMWQEPLPFEHGANIIPSNRATFAADSATAYIGTSIPGQVPTNQYCYLYAVAVVDPPASPFDLNTDGIVDGADLGLAIGSWGLCASCDPCQGDVNGDCVVDGGDLGLLLSNWG